MHVQYQNLSKRLNKNVCDDSFISVSIIVTKYYVNYLLLLLLLLTQEKVYVQTRLNTKPQTVEWNVCEPISRTRHLGCRNKEEDGLSREVEVKVNNRSRSIDCRDSNRSKALRYVTNRRANSSLSKIDRKRE